VQVKLEEIIKCVIEHCIEKNS